MSLQSKVLKLQGKGGDHDKLAKTIVLTMRDMHWSWQDLMATPVPTFMAVVDILNKDAKEQNQRMKQQNKGRR